VSPEQDTLADTRTEAASSDEFVARVYQALSGGGLDAVPDEELREVLTAAIKLFAAKAEERGTHIDPVDIGRITPTELVTLTAALLRAGGLSLFDLSMWLGRPQT
jgi:hypothetical protein